ncbi:hypothetical protein QJS10_CPA09g00888 [Acorus calamus]|uniref:Uncharacterized protein n=1 Tax=Acorus calamus TaxID=4465 RepID=A0AAV9EB61_ACOCL|nr:hypothetical protein QJS10_CPA09g00888 [Acorus calamus]
MECQNRRSRSEATGRRRPALLDLNEEAGPTTGDAAATNSSVSPSPRLVVSGVLAMKRSSVPSRRSPGTFPSHDTPNYGSNTAGLHKGWSSVQVPLLSNNGSGRPIMPDPLKNQNMCARLSGCTS